MIDFTHLDALQLRLSHERERLNAATKQKEIALRKVWVAGIEKEIAAEYKFLGVEAAREMTMEEVAKCKF